MGDYNLPGVDWDRGWSASEGEMLVVDTFADKFWTHIPIFLAIPWICSLLAVLIWWLILRSWDT